MPAKKQAPVERKKRKLTTEVGSFLSCNCYVQFHQHWLFIDYIVIRWLGISHVLLTSDLGVFSE